MRGTDLNPFICSCVAQCIESVCFLNVALNMQCFNEVDILNVIDLHIMFYQNTSHLLLFVWHGSMRLDAALNLSSYFTYLQLKLICIITSFLLPAVDG